MKPAPAIASLMLPGLLAVAAWAAPSDGSYAQFIRFCASSLRAGQACGVYYQGVFDGFRTQEAAGDFNCDREFSSIRYIEVHNDYMAAGRGERLGPRAFLTALYKEVRGCRP